MIDIITILSFGIHVSPPSAGRIDSKTNQSVGNNMISSWRDGCFPGSLQVTGENPGCNIVTIVTMSMGGRAFTYSSMEYTRSRLQVVGA